MAYIKGKALLRERLKQLKIIKSKKQVKKENDKVISQEEHEERIAKLKAAGIKL